MKTKEKNDIFDDNGSVMLTVIIAFLFISVLIAIIMPLTVLNYRMKAVERHSKDEFYYVEKSLNEIYSGVGKECAQELGKVYSSTLASSYDFTDDSLAYEKFCNNYVKRLVEIFYGQSNTSRVNLKTHFNDDYLTSGAKTKALVSNSVDDTDNNTYIKVVFIKKDGTEVNTPNSGDYSLYKKIVIKDIYVASVAGSDYKSSITTDIVIQIPEISFFRINENELDYALVGCKGLVFNGSADITGNIYGGVDKDLDEEGNKVATYYSGGIEVARGFGGVEKPEVTLKSNYVVSAGDISVNDGILKIEKGHSTNNNEIWLENTVVGKKKDSEDKPSTVEICGDTYALNDLQIEGKGKEVKFTGSYYGYGDGGSTLDSKESYFKAEDLDYYDEHVRSQSSSIIVNAAESKVDLNKLKNLVLLGQAYIDHNSKYDVNNSENTPKVDNPTDARLSKDETGMSGTMKASQEILLVPEEFLDLPNPMKIDSQMQDLKPDENGKEAINEWISNNFSGKVKLDSSSPTRTVKIQKSGSVYAYCYFQFDNSDGKENEYRNAYIKCILNAPLDSEPSTAKKPTLQTLKKRIIMAAESQRSTIQANAISNVYAKNAGIISFDYNKNTSTDGDGNSQKNLNDFNDIGIISNTSDIEGYSYASSATVGNFSRKYKDLITYLDFNSSFKKDIITTDYLDPDYPFGRLWWTNGISDGTKKLDLGGCRVIVQGNDTLYLGQYIKDNPMNDNSLNDGDYLNLIVLSNGDVVIDDSIKMKGFIFSKGKIIVNNDKKLEIISDLSVVQKRISSEIAELKTNMPSNADNNQINSEYKDGYLIRYLLKTNYKDTGNIEKYCNKDATEVIGNRRYNISTKDTSDSTMVVNSDYTSFVTFERWRKTGAGGK